MLDEIVADDCIVVSENGITQPVITTKAVLLERASQIAQADNISSNDSIDLRQFNVQRDGVDVVVDGDAVAHLSGRSDAPAHFTYTYANCQGHLRLIYAKLKAQ